MPSNPTPKASPPTDYKSYAWINGASRFESACIRIEPDGRVYVGAKGWDTKNRAPGFIQVELTTIGIQDLGSLAAKALSNKTGSTPKKAA